MNECTLKVLMWFVVYNDPHPLTIGLSGGRFGNECSLCTLNSSYNFPGPFSYAQMDLNSGSVMISHSI